MNKMLSAVLAAMTICATTPAMAAELVTNGNFETGSFSPWTATGNVDIFLSPNGTRAPAFNGGDRAPNAVISQTIATAVGNAYMFSFDYFMNGQVAGQSIFASVLDSGTGVSLGNRVVSSSSATPRRFSFNFTALSGSSIIRFSDVASNNTVSQDGYIDNVSVTAAVPEPATWAMMLLGFGGIGYAMRRKKVSTRIRFA